MFAPGALLDNRYEIVGPLGGGGMGEVYRARRTHLGDEVAIKVMRASFDEDSELRQRFVRESRACARLRHPHIVSILDFNVLPGGQPYLVMELLSGPTLRDEMEVNGPMAPQAIAVILTSVASALQLAHDQGITHRDLKPANIVAHRYESGERVYKVIDFGLASVQERSDSRLTDPNQFVGTLAYAAPEQVSGQDVGQAADVYAAGVIVYELLTGRRPFDAENRMTLVNQALTAMPESPARRRAGLSAAVDAVVMRALAKDPAARWPTIAAFAAAFRDASGAHVTSPEPVARQDVLLARYELGDLVGRGRLGSLVYRGTHRALGVPVAIRLLKRDGVPHWEAVRARFLIEARTLQVPHPNLLQVRDYGEDDRVVFVVTEFVEGPSLHEELAREGKLPWRDARHLLLQMLDATTALNLRGGYVMGVNPDMIRLTPEGHHHRVVMSSAGITGVQDLLATMREQELRGEEASERELPYIAPEVLMGRALTPAADVFTIGVLAYRMVTGTVPFRAPSVLELVGQMLQTTPAEPRAFNRDLPEGASAAILRALAPEAAQRFATARALAEALG